MTRTTLCLIVAALTAMLAAMFLGSTPMAPSRVLAAMAGQGEAGDAVIVWLIRFPRALAAFCAGAALGISGAALQGLLRNPLAEPGVLGVSASATLAATVVLYFGLAGTSLFAIPAAAIVGALAATALLALVASRIASMTSLILVGIGLSSFAGAIMALLLNLAPNPFSLADMINWTLGSVANRSMQEVLASAPFMLTGGLVLLTQRRSLTALSLGEEAAAGVGLHVDRARMLVVLGAGLATGGSVALAGAIGFVGIVAPHLARPLVNHDPGRALVPSALLAGVFLVVADIGVRLIPTVAELRLGVVAALVGAPIFVLVATRGRGA